MLHRSRKIRMVKATHFRKLVASYVAHVHHTGERIEVWRHGKRAAALVSIADLEVLEDLGRHSLRQRELQHEINMEAFRREECGYEWDGE